MKKVFKIYQTDFALEDQKGHSEQDIFLKLDDWEYETLKEAEIALQKHLNLKGDTGEFTILPVYTKE